MDATTNIQDSFPREDFLVDRDMGLLGVEDSYLDVFNLDAFGSNNNGLSHEPETTPFTQTWEGIHMEQSVSMLPYMGEDEYIWPDIMTSSDDTSQFDPSPSLLPSEYFESTNYYLSPSLPRQETELQLLNAPVNTIEQLTVDWKLSPNLPTTCRRILPRPLEQTCIGSENGHHCQVEKAKKRPYDSSRRKRRKVTDQHQCRLCGKMTPSKKSLDRHHVVSHKNYAASRGLDTGPFLCSSPGCKKTYTRKDNLTRHFNKKHERKCR